MKVFGLSVTTLLLIFVAFFLGTKYPQALASVPVVGKL